MSSWDTKLERSCFIWTVTLAEFCAQTQKKEPPNRTSQKGTANTFTWMVRPENYRKLKRLNTILCTKRNHLKTKECFAQWWLVKDVADSQIKTFKYRSAELSWSLIQMYADM